MQTPLDESRQIPRRVLLVVGTFLLSLLLYIDRICISAAKDSITGDLQLTDEQFGWVLSVFSLGYAFCQTPGGYLADRFGPRRVLAGIVAAWSLFTGLTAAAFNFVSLLVIRLLFGAGEAGAYPGLAQATYAWIPQQERGLVQGINFSGGRFGAAGALWVMPPMIEHLGWRMSFVVLMIIGFAWSAFWLMWYRDDPEDHPGIAQEELDYILANRQKQTSQAAVAPLSTGTLLSSSNMWLLCAQYFASNFTFFFALTWWFPHMKERYELTSSEASLYTAIPFLAGALGHWSSGRFVDILYRQGGLVASRRIPAIVGFALSAVGVAGCAFAQSPVASIVWFSLAIFGGDMTIAPSWTTCIDIGRRHSGFISGTMNMAGNIGSFLTALAFPYLESWTSSTVPFFALAACLNVVAVFLWIGIDPRRPLGEPS